MSKRVLGSMSIVALVAACGARDTTTRRDAVGTPVPTFLHTGFSAGPAVFTDASGHVVEERRTEPFGAPIGTHDLVARDLNALNKRTDAATGWSDHGARWLAPETGRWHSPDPIVVAPDASFMAMPWALHPYQYVHQNPVAFWDPDGRCSAPTLGPGQVGICIEAYIARSYADKILWIFPVGEGNDRGPSGTDASLTSKIQQQITIDLHTGKIVNTTDISDSHAMGITRRASGSSRLLEYGADRANNIHLVAGGHAVNGFSSLPLAPQGSIDYRFGLTVDAKGDTTLDWGVHKGFPSYSVYAYKRDANGNVGVTTLHESHERELDDLKTLFNGVDPLEIKSGPSPDAKHGEVETLTTKNYPY